MGFAIRRACILGAGKLKKPAGVRRVRSEQGHWQAEEWSATKELCNACPQLPATANQLCTCEQDEAYVIPQAMGWPRARADISAYSLKTGCTQSPLPEKSLIGTSGFPRLTTSASFRSPAGEGKHDGGGHSMLVCRACCPPGRQSCCEAVARPSWIHLVSGGKPCCAPHTHCHAPLVRQTCRGR